MTTIARYDEVVLGRGTTSNTDGAFADRIREYVPTVRRHAVGVDAQHMPPTSQTPTQTPENVWDDPGATAVRHAAAAIGRRNTPVQPTSVRVSGLEKWHGRIVELTDETFTAELVPDVGGRPLQADFDLELLGDSEAGVGDVVYVTSRTVQDPGGYRTRTSAVRLRRVGVWSIEEADEFARAADAAYDEFSRYVE